jgi:hypothetical protein
VYSQPKENPFPQNLLYSGPKQRQHHIPVWQFIVFGTGILILGALLWIGYRSIPAKLDSPDQVAVPPAKNTTSTPVLAPSTASVSSAPTNTPGPVATSTSSGPSNSPTALPHPNRTLDVPIMVGQQPILMHRIADGEQILFLTEQQHTTIKVLEWINYETPVPLIVGKVIVIAPGMMNIDQSLPPFEPYQVMDPLTSIQGLAGKLGVDLKKLEYYNNCSDACQFAKGDWVLVPPRTNIPTPNTPTPAPTSTPSSRIHTLEVPIQVGNQQLILHRVTDGDQVIFLMKQYQTTVEALQEINFQPAVPLLVNQVIVIAPGVIINIDPKLPPFEPYQVIDNKIEIEGIALKLGIDLNTLKYYNNCPNGCSLIKGDWILIPHTK